VTEKLNRLSDKVSELFEARARRLKRASWFVKFVMVAGASAVVSAMQFAQVPKDGTISTVQVVGLVFSGVVLIGAVFTLVSEQDASEELATARKAAEEARDANEALEFFTAYEDTLDRTLALYQSVGEWRRIIERAVVERQTLAPILSAMMEVTERSLPIALGFKQSHQWTVCIYRAHRDGGTGRDVLRCVAHTRAIRCGIGEARSWPEGVGACGIAFSHGREIIIPNMHAPGLTTIFDLGEHGRSYDQDRYRSVAAIPVRLDDQKKPWGVVIATNDQYDHFTTEEESGPAETTEPVKALAGMVALAAVLFKESNSRLIDGEGPPSLPVQ
jgi:GAF domain-containing protein